MSSEGRSQAMSAPTLSLSPHQAKPHDDSTEAWWYENAKSITVYIVGPDGRTASCSISRRYLAPWLAKTTKGAKP
jgi:hypothetical protein